MVSNVGRWGWFGAWGVIGAGLALGLISLGPLALVPAIAAAAIMLSGRRVRQSAWGLLSGTGIVMLIVAWVNRQGPGTTCWQNASGHGCDSHLSPIPWLVIGVALLLAGGLGQRLNRR
jgi:hypothetical protein